MTTGLMMALAQRPAVLHDTMRFERSANDGRIRIGRQVRLANEQHRVGSVYGAFALEGGSQERTDVQRETRVLGSPARHRMHDPIEPLMLDMAGPLTGQIRVIADPPRTSVFVHPHSVADKQDAGRPAVYEGHLV